MFHGFVSHSGEQKDSLALPIYNGIKKRNANFLLFVDKQELRPGNHSHEIIVEAMNTAPIGIFILSPQFLAKQWPMKELDRFLSRLERSKELGDDRLPVIIPVFAGILVDDCSLSQQAFFAKYWPWFSNPHFRFWERVHTGETSQEHIMETLAKIKAISGVVLNPSRGDQGLIEDTIAAIQYQWKQVRPKL